jgi:hypothetical protein
MNKTKSFLVLLLLFSITGNLTYVYADIPRVDDIYIEFKSPPENVSIILFNVRHLDATLNHYIDRVELDVDGEVLILDPPSPSSQVGNNLVEYNFTVQGTQLSQVRARVRCTVHRYSSWTQLNNRVYRLRVKQPEGFGSTDPVPATYTYSDVVSVPVMATPIVNWSFDHWVLDGVNLGDQNPYTVNMERNHNIMAVFTGTTPPSLSNYTLIIEPPEGSGDTDPVPGSYTYHQVVDVTITASPDSGWVLEGWLVDGVNAGEENTITVTMDEDHIVKASFTEAPVTLYTIIIEPPEGQGTTDPIPDTYVYYETQSLHVTAVPDSGWILDHWMLDDEIVDDENPITVNVDGDHNIRAFFQEDETSSNGIPGYPVNSIILGILLCICILYFVQKCSHFY